MARSGQAFVVGSTDREFMANLEFMKTVRTLFTREELLREGIPYSRINSWWHMRSFPAGRNRTKLEKMIEDKQNGIRKTNVKESV